MELLPEGKNFRLVQDSELPEILKFLEGHLPTALKFHQALKTFLKDRVWDFYFYVAKTWPDDPVALHFPGMTSSPNGHLYESFCIFCPCERLECLRLLETEDVLIDWTKPIFLNFTHVAIMERIEQFYGNIGTLDKVWGDVYVCSEPPDDEHERAPLKDADVQTLRAEHAKAIHDLYPANDMEALEVFEKLIHALPAYGVFSSSGELAAWMVQSYYGAMFSMQTRPEFRRKGYGIHLARCLTKVVVERGYVPFVVIRPENEASKRLYHKLGFRKHYQTVRAILRPFGASKDDMADIDAHLTEVPPAFVDVPVAFADAAAAAAASLDMIANPTGRDDDGGDVGVGVGVGIGVGVSAVPAPAGFDEGSFSPPPPIFPAPSLPLSPLPSPPRSPPRVRPLSPLTVAPPPPMPSPPPSPPSLPSPSDAPPTPTPTPTPISLSQQ